ncbi:MAG: TlpA family protein disulfide reductase [Vulcanimicrobiaceae bacterium]
MNRLLAGAVFAGLLAPLAAVAGPNLANVGGPLPAAMQGKPVVAVVRADWCPSCKEVEPVLHRVLDRYGSKVSYVALNVTNSKTATAAAALAGRDGLAKFYESAKEATSTVAIVDPKTGNVVAEFYDQTDPAAYRAAIDKALTLAK